MANLLQCDVMLLVMQTVLKRSLDLNARSFSESHLQKVLHLIGYAIHEQMSNNYPFLLFHERASKWGLLQLMEELVNKSRVCRKISEQSKRLKIINFSNYILGCRSP